jgi:solute carrier family 25 carnitine/acylcarnitine transporter 20/29
MTISNSFWNEVLAATAAGCTCTVVGHPLDTIKVHMQASPASSSITPRVGTFQTAATLLRQKALFRGIGPPMANAIIMNAAMFSVFGAVKDVCGDSATGSLTAGVVAGFATACISTPTDFVKIQAQLRGVDSLSVLREIKRSPTTLFRGHVANLIREGVFTAVYLGLYDMTSPQGFWQITATSSLTGALAWVVSFPADTIKSVIQAQIALGKPLTIRQACHQIYSREHSVTAFYRGCGASTTRAAIVTSLRMLTYEAVLNALA